MYNFYGHIALRTETIARSILSIDNETFRDTFVSAERINLGSFVEVMLFVLRTVHGYEADLDDFALKAQPYLGVSGKDIPEKEANVLLEQFIVLTNQSLYWRDCHK